MAIGDGLTAAGALDLDATTVVGGIRCTTLDASNSLLARDAAGRRPAAGRRLRASASRRGACATRSCPTGRAPAVGSTASRTPTTHSRAAGDQAPLRRRCASGRRRTCRLHTAAHPRIRRGADDESEMGVTHRCLRAPARGESRDPARRVPAVRPLGRLVHGDREARHDKHANDREGTKLMSADLSRVRFDAAPRPHRRDAAAGSPAARRRLERAGADPRAAAGRGNVVDLDGEGPEAGDRRASRSFRGRRPTPSR